MLRYLQVADAVICAVAEEDDAREHQYRDREGVIRLPPPESTLRYTRAWRK